MKKMVKMTLVALFAIMASVGFSQEWSKTQKEVWQVVENSWVKWKSGDFTGMASFIHEKYQGWNQENPLPMTKEEVLNLYNLMKDNYKLNAYLINPARITVTDNAAVVDYYFQYQVTITEGEKKVLKSYHGKNVEFYVKEGGKWLLLGDMTFTEGQKEKEKE